MLLQVCIGLVPKEGVPRDGGERVGEGDHPLGGRGDTR